LSREIHLSERLQLAVDSATGVHAISLLKPIHPLNIHLFRNPIILASAVAAEQSGLSDLCNENRSNIRHQLSLFILSFTHCCGRHYVYERIMW